MSSKKNKKTPSNRAKQSKLAENSTLEQQAVNANMQTHPMQKVTSEKENNIRQSNITQSTRRVIDESSHAFDYFQSIEEDESYTSTLDMPAVNISLEKEPERVLSSNFPRPKSDFKSTQTSRNHAKWSAELAVQNMRKSALSTWVDSADYQKKVVSSYQKNVTANIPGSRGALSPSEDYKKALQIFSSLPNIIEEAKARRVSFSDIISVQYSGQPDLTEEGYKLNAEQLKGISKTVWDHCNEKRYFCSLIPHFNRHGRGYHVEFWIRIRW